MLIQDKVSKYKQGDTNGRQRRMVHQLCFCVSNVINIRYFDPLRTSKTSFSERWPDLRFNYKNISQIPILFYALRTEKHDDLLQMEKSISLGVQINSCRMPSGILLDF